MSFLRGSIYSFFKRNQNINIKSLFTRTFWRTLYHQRGHQLTRTESLAMTHAFSAVSVSQSVAALPSLRDSSCLVRCAGFFHGAVFQDLLHALTFVSLSFFRGFIRPILVFNSCFCLSLFIFCYMSFYGPWSFLLSLISVFFHLLYLVFLFSSLIPFFISRYLIFISFFIVSVFTPHFSLFFLVLLHDHVPFVSTCSVAYLLTSYILTFMRISPKRFLPFQCSDKDFVSILIITTRSICPTHLTVLDLVIVIMCFKSALLYLLEVTVTGLRIQTSKL
jgi:hypothetical protein